MLLDEALSISVDLPQSATEPEQKMNPFKFVDPVLSHQADHARVGSGAGHWTGDAQLAGHHVSVVVECSIASD